MKKVAIVGGGIAGLASAIFLARLGYEITIYEQAAKAGPVGAGFLLQPPGQAVLEKLGVLEAVAAYAVPISGLRSQTASGRKILDLRYQDLGDPVRFGLGIQRSTIYDALLNKAKSNLNIEFIWGSKVVECKPEIDKVSVLTEGKVEHVFDVCILSSGSNSSLANEHFSNRICRPYRWACLWSTITLPENFSPSVLHQRCFKSNKMMGILPVRKMNNGYEAALYWSLKVDDAKEFDNAISVEKSSNEKSIKIKEFKKIKDEISNFWPEAAPAISGLNACDFVLARYNDIWTPKPFKDGVIALGDVSHATSPQLGQGCTMALLDAYLLAECVSASNSFSNDTLQRWWNSRRNQIAYVRYLSRFLTPLFQSDNISHAFFRDWLVAPMGRTPLFNKLQLKTLASEVFLNTRL